MEIIVRRKANLEITEFSIMSRFYGVSGIICALTFSFTSSISALGEEIIVSKGDTLTSLAKKHLGDGSKWTDLCQMNRGTIGDNCNRIIVGAKLKLPVPPKPVYELTVAGEEGKVFTAPEGYSIDRPSDADYVLLSGYEQEKPKPWSKNGIWMEFPAELLTEISGKKVTFSAEVAGEAAGSIETSLAIAGVGNSGWKTFSVSKDLKEITFEYQVPAIKPDSKMYLGILPDPNKVGQKIKVSDVAIYVQE
jgi:hypothetical protein